jgi:tetratricopeptide (TPR) repeat protein
MKMDRVIKKTAAVLFVSAMIIPNINGQDRNDVIKAFNDGAKTMQTDPQAAITAFENVVTLSGKVGDTANDLKQKAEQVLPGLYVKVAANAINDKKPAPDVVKAAKAAARAAEKYNNTTAKENAGKLLAQGYYNLGIDLFTKKDYNNALLAFDSVLLVNPGFSAAIYNKALIYRTQNNAPAFEENIDMFIDKVKGTSDSAKIKQASRLALEYFRAAGSQANQANKLDEALPLLEKAEKYGEDKDLCYFFADVYNKKKEFDKGAEYARKGLALETGNAEAKAKFYFQLGLAQAGKGETSEACASFKNSLYGPFAEPSKAERKNLKCQ